MTPAYPASGTLRDGLWIKKVPSKYTPAQVAQYLSAIEYEPSYDAEAIAAGKFPINLDTLSRVMRLHMLTIPFENTPMHYSPDHTMDVSPQGLFDRFVKERKGSYCFGLNNLLLDMLRGLGFRSYVSVGRVNEAGPGSPPIYTPPTHLVIFVQPSADSNQTYVVDVGFGISCIVKPILLSNHPDNVNVGMSETERHRLTLTAPPDSSLSHSADLSTSAGEQWNMEAWHKKPGSSEGTWRHLYSFTEDAEYWPTDITFGSFGVYTHPAPTGIFWNNIICLKLFTIDEGNLHLEKSKRPVYRITLFRDEVRKSYGAETEVLRKLKTEEDRIKAIREVFGINVKDEDVKYITGRAPAFTPAVN